MPNMTISSSLILPTSSSSSSFSLSKKNSEINNSYNRSFDDWLSGGSNKNNNNSNHATGDNKQDSFDEDQDDDGSMNFDPILERNDGGGEFGSISKPDLQKQNRISDLINSHSESIGGSSGGNDNIEGEIGIGMGVGDKNSSHRLLIIMITIFTVCLIIFSILISITIVLCVVRNKRNKSKQTMLPMTMTIINTNNNNDNINNSSQSEQLLTQQEKKINVDGGNHNLSPQIAQSDLLKQQQQSLSSTNSTPLHKIYNICDDHHQHIHRQQQHHRHPPPDLISYDEVLIFNSHIPSSQPLSSTSTTLAEPTIYRDFISLNSDSNYNSYYNTTLDTATLDTTIGHNNNELQQQLNNTRIGVEPKFLCEPISVNNHISILANNNNNTCQYSPASSIAEHFISTDQGNIQLFTSNPTIIDGDYESSLNSLSFHNPQQSPSLLLKQYHYHPQPHVHHSQLNLSFSKVIIIII